MTDSRTAAERWLAEQIATARTTLVKGCRECQRWGERCSVHLAEAVLSAPGVEVHDLWSEPGCKGRRRTAIFVPDDSTDLAAQPIGDAP